MLATTFASAALFILGAARTAAATPCIAMDSTFNLYAFGLNGKDYNAGLQSTWTSSTAAKDITTTGRPPFDGANTTCYLAQFFNAIYFLNADASDKSALYIFNAAGSGSWSKQSVTAGSFDTTNFEAILDHDTNIFYAISSGELWTLDLGSQTSANSTAIAWNDVEKASLPAGYDPVMAIAQNHVHFLNVPGNSAGQASIYVIHFNYFQPEVQSYAGSNNFPDSHGQITSFFQPDGQGVQQEFAFIPDNGQNTFVINVENNSTTSLAAPPTTDPSARYFAGVTALVQLTSAGAVNFLPYQQGQASTNTAAKWAPVANIAAAAPPSSSSASPSGSGGASGSGTSKTATGTGSHSGSATGTGSSPSSTSSGSNGATGKTAAFGLTGAAVLAAVAFLA